MRVLLDSKALVWWFSSDSRLSVRAARVIKDPRNEIVVSVASAWELAIKNHLGKLPMGGLLERLPRDLEEAGVAVLPINLDHAIRAGSLPGHHKDPFDRMLVAQAQADNLAIVSSDPIFGHYGVRRLW
jgi:PIN domain nuclease of toxin-antitoxin system